MAEQSLPQIIERYRRDIILGRVVPPGTGAQQDNWLARREVLRESLEQEDGASGWHEETLAYILGLIDEARSAAVPDLSKRVFQKPI